MRFYAQRCVKIGCRNIRQNKSSLSAYNVAYFDQLIGHGEYMCHEKSIKFCVMTNIYVMVRPPLLVGVLHKILECTFCEEVDTVNYLRRFNIFKHRCKLLNVCLDFA